MHAKEVKDKVIAGSRATPRYILWRPLLRRYLGVRAKVIAKIAPANDHPFPVLRDVDGDGCYLQQKASDLKKIVRKETGVDLDGRGCGRTHGRRAIDRGVPVDAVSRML